MSEPGWEMQAVNEERYWLTCDALNRCARSGADIDALRLLAHECGVDIKHTILGDEIRAVDTRAARLG